MQWPEAALYHSSKRCEANFQRNFKVFQATATLRPARRPHEAHQAGVASPKCWLCHALYLER